jgi:hypothetical protein
MKLLLNNKEIAHFLASQIKYAEAAYSVPYDTTITQQLEVQIKVEKSKKKYRLYGLDDDLKKRIKNKIFKSVEEELKAWIDQVNESIDYERQCTFELIHENIDRVLEKLGEEKVLEKYKNSSKQNFVKSVGLRINSDGELIRRKNFTDYSQDCLIRNTVGNEDLLVTKVDRKYPFWFIDSGYTNFLEPNKKWHRIVRNHLHHGKFFDAPCYRLSNFNSFPLPWRQGGEKIMVIEPGPFAAGIFHVDLKTWRYDIEKEIRKYSDRPIVFREKMPKKERTRLYDHLLEEDYYCLVNINSNAATEAIWAGIPVITLDRHITNPVSRSKISEINDLYRSTIGDWLAMLSYSQFTYEELISGKALELVAKYHV